MTRPTGCQSGMNQPKSFFVASGRPKYSLTAASFYGAVDRKPIAGRFGIDIANDVFPS